MNRIERIRSQLQTLQPIELDVIDESHLHVGHAGARDGRGHFKIRIISQEFTGKNPLARHRLVYKALGNLMETDIHALGIEAITSEEAPQELK